MAWSLPAIPFWFTNCNHFFIWGLKPWTWSYIDCWLVLDIGKGNGVYCQWSCRPWRLAVLLWLLDLSKWRHYNPLKCQQSLTWCSITSQIWLLNSMVVRTWNLPLSHLIGGTYSCIIKWCTNYSLCNVSCCRQTEWLHGSMAVSSTAQVKLGWMPCARSRMEHFLQM